MRNKNNEQKLDNFNTFLAKKGQHYTSTNSLDEIVHDLQQLSNQAKYQVNCHWEINGSNVLREIQYDRNPKVIRLIFGSPYLIKPTQLETFYFSRQPDFSFLRLSYQGLPPSGINKQIYTDEEMEEEEKREDRQYDDESEMQIKEEQYVEIYDGTFLPRECLETGIMGYDEESGREIYLPADYQLITRELKDGHLMLVSIGSLLNDSQLNVTRIYLTKDGKDCNFYPDFVRDYA